MVSYREMFRFLWQFIKLQRWTFLAILLLDSAAWTSDALVWPYILHMVVDIFTRFDDNRFLAWEALKDPILWGIGLVLFVETASRGMGFLMGRALPTLQADIRMHMFDHVQRHSPRYFNERFAGSLANQITDMTQQVETIIRELWWPMIPTFTATIFGAVILGSISPLFMWIFLTWIFLHIFVCVWFTKSCDVIQERHGEIRSSLLGKIVDSLTNNFAVNLFYRFAEEKKKIAFGQKQEKASNIAAWVYAEKVHCLISLVHFAGFLAGINGSILYLWIHGHITTGQAVQVFTTVWSLSQIMWTLGTSFPNLFRAIGTAKQAYAVMKDPKDIEDFPNAKKLQVREGEIVFENVSFRYGEKQLFENKHVYIKGGEKIGLVGFTGAGKSTFVNLILRFFPVERGKIRIDGQDINSVTLQSLRSSIALIPQEPVLFHRTLRENIAFGKEGANEDEILKAAKLAHCDEFIQAIPKQYEAKVGERGTKLSGGEKQRIAIARAILADAPILILDEATSSLDSVTEKYIQDSFEKLMEGRTTIAIAHRLSTLSAMDRILVFDKGKIVEEGSPENLLKRGGLYAKMWKMQAGGFLPDAP